METVSPQRERVIRVTVACGILATVAVLLRFIARWRSKASFGADDWWMVASLILSYCMLAAGSIMITSGKGGRHVNTLTESQMTTFLKTLDAALITYTLTTAMVKISILLLYRRIFDTIKFRRATLIVGIACILWLLAALLCLAFQCHTDAERYNLKSLSSNQCINLKDYWYAVSGSNMALDLIIFLMPLYTVCSLKLARRQKVALSAIFALGVLVCVAGLMRIITMDLIKGGDLTYTILTFHMWSQIEPIMAIVCACITTFRPLFAGIDLKLMTYLNWNGRRTASSSLAKTKGRWPDRRNDPESDLKKAKRMRSLSGCREGDLEMLNLDQVVHTQTLGNIRFIKSAESLKRADSWQGEGQSTTARVKTEESFV